MIENKIPLPVEQDAMVERWARLRPYLLDPREDYPEPYYMLEYNGVPFSTIGGIQAMSGQKKNGKSFVFTMLMAAVLGSCEAGSRTGEYLPGLSVPQRTIDYLGHLPNVLYCDTEMEKLNTAKVLRRVHWLCGWDMKEPHDRLSILWLKTMPKDDKVPAWKQRFDLIKEGIDLLRPDIVFIDGMRDLMASINDEETATHILEYLGTTAEEKHICIWNALHQNPRINSDGDDKMRGWAGTELGNKVSDTLVSIKKKDDRGVTFTVKQVDARGKDMEDFKFEITDDAGNLGIPKIISTGSAKEATYDDPAVIRGWIEEARNGFDWPMTRQQVKKIVFGQVGGQKNSTRQQQDLEVAINMSYLVESTMKSGNGSYMLLPNDDMPF